MDSISYLAIVACLLAAGIHGRALDDLDNSVHGDGGGNNALQSADWVKVTQAPSPIFIQSSGFTVELECEVSGTPTPSIHWVRGNNPQNSVSCVSMHSYKKYNGYKSDITVYLFFGLYRLEAMSRT